MNMQNDPTRQTNFLRIFINKLLRRLILEKIRFLQKFEINASNDIFIPFIIIHDCIGWGAIW
jgi:hypothetical protein